MTPAERALLAALERRALRLAKFAHVALRTDAHLPIITAHAGGLVLRTLFLLCGDEVRKDFMRWLLHTMRESAGLCMCGAMKQSPGDPLCVTCLEEISRDEKELDQAEAMDASTDGSKH